MRPYRMFREERECIRYRKQDRQGGGVIKLLIGSWIQAAGTVTAAVGSTPSKRLSEESRVSLELWGNVLQAGGNSLIADTFDEVTFDMHGNWIQAMGNTVVVSGIVLPVEGKVKLTLFGGGNFIQAIGGGLSFADSFEGEAEPYEGLYAIGNLLQMIGNSMQGYASMLEKKALEAYRGDSSEAEGIELSGSWIQAAGSLLNAITLTKEKWGLTPGAVTR